MIDAKKTDKPTIFPIQLEGGIVNQELLSRSDWGSVIVSRKEGVIENVVTTSVDYQIRANDRYIIADTACTLTLPIVNKGKVITIKSTVAGTITITGGTIDGVVGTTLTVQYEFINLLYNGSEWSNI